MVDSGYRNGVNVMRLNQRSTLKGTNELEGTSQWFYFFIKQSARVEDAWNVGQYCVNVTAHHTAGKESLCVDQRVLVPLQ